MSSQVLFPPDFNPRNVPNSNPQNINANGIPLNPLNNSQPIYNIINISVYPNRIPDHVYNNRPIPNLPIRQRLIQSELAIRQRENKGKLCFLACFTLKELIILIVMFCVPWFNYCYWEFNLNIKHRNVKSDISLGNNKSNIADFYDEICPGNPYPLCPDLCASIENVKHSGNIIYGFGSACIFISILIFIIEFKKCRNPDLKISFYLIYAMNASTLVLSVIGFIIYYTTSGFNENFDDPKRENMNHSEHPNNFGWSAGIILNTVLFVIQLTKISASKYLLV
ncbi:hypothetical protein SteCoe_274 [Stentor coeruleus]|uniref:Uncharacterized protein n=1 Tax=Stentor coeruleus TaxID=5963 RepID=A0A1R2D4F9_9CILI|nr:hypothetical protein SteCoe_274 [Stentor coeruleus]